ncbi:GNAT family N-acetyltransferase [Flavobacterium sp. F-380]|uniref:GNAT family N-acetyltransferase n=1 Tax=Flavobacterium kayseriense TaxID=2764714 RepID=A0ABR7JA58_9FLAO|nr:GNAT family N-acetyltransferase [Flavobacterium kayseriense]MBC5842077.1 GNAT family N-acetyltransferase [Flavobacterium kayseriense]MBC5848607.1 GNAT family N-acetyltransferase [Flavobacterium kayseriense]
MQQQFRKATTSEIPQIWVILQQAIARRKADGSNQWQDGYPNPEVILNDITKNAGYVLLEDEDIVGYVALLINDEPEYANIEGQWLTNNDFVVFHRVAIAENQLGKGLAKKLLYYIEEFALANEIYSIKADTNFDNQAMITIFEKLGYAYCGQVYFRGSARRAYEKILTKNV